MPLWKRSFALTLCGIALAASAALAQNKAEPSNTGKEARRDPAALILRDKALKSYHDLHALHEKITQKQWKTDPADALTVEIEFKFRKPNHMYLVIDYPNVTKPGRWQIIYACNGKSLTFYNSAQNEYQIQRAPAKLDKLILPYTLRGPEFVALLREISPFDDLEKTADVRYAEAFENPNGQPVRLLKLDMEQDGAKRALVYRMDGKDNLVRGFTLKIVPVSDGPSPFRDPEPESTVEAQYNLVEINPRFTDLDFSFVPPAGAKMKKTDAPASK